jgi:hypothetical protein
MTVETSIEPRCNIGPDELARRRRSAIPMTVLTAAVAAALLATHAPVPVRFLLWPVATGAAIGWLQVVHRFCVAFGALGLENFGRLGGQVHVDPRLVAADRRRAAILVGQGVLVGLLATLAFVALPA